MKLASDSRPQAAYSVSTERIAMLRRDARERAADHRSYWRMKPPFSRGVRLPVLRFLPSRIISTCQSRRCTLTPCDRKRTTATKWSPSPRSNDHPLEVEGGPDPYGLPRARPLLVRGQGQPRTENPVDPSQVLLQRLLIENP